MNGIIISSTVSFDPSQIKAHSSNQQSNKTSVYKGNLKKDHFFNLIPFILVTSIGLGEEQIGNQQARQLCFKLSHAKREYFTAVARHYVLFALQDLNT